MNFQNIFGALDFTTLNWDLFVLFVFAAGVGLYVFKWGKDQAFIMLISSYISFAFVSRLGLWEKVLDISLKDSFSDKTIAFLGMTFLIFLVLSRSSFTSVFNRGSRRAWVDTLVIGFLQIGAVTAMIVSFLSPSQIDNLSIFLKSVFAEDGAQFFWFVAPILAIFLLKGK